MAERSPGLSLLRLVINNKSEERGNISYLCADGRHTEGVACSGTPDRENSTFPKTGRRRPSLPIERERVRALSGIVSQADGARYSGNCTGPYDRVSGALLRRRRRKNGRG